MAQLVKNLPAIQGTWVQSLGWEDPLEKGIATHSSTLAWKIPWAEEPIGCSPQGCEELATTERLHFHFSLLCIGEGNGNPLKSPLDLPGESQGWGSLVGCRLWGRTEWDMTETT